MKAKQQQSKQPNQQLLSRTANNELTLTIQQEENLVGMVQRAIHDSRALSPRDIFLLQRTIGNRAIGKLVQQSNFTPNHKISESYAALVHPKLTTDAEGTKTSVIQEQQFTMSSNASARVARQSLDAGISVPHDASLPGGVPHTPSSPEPANQLMEVILIARSVGKPAADKPLKREGHAGLVINLGKQGRNDHWLVQGGPQGDPKKLVGGVHHCSSGGWYQEFSNAQGAIWKTGEPLTLPVIVLARVSVPVTTTDHLVKISEKINSKNYAYDYENGPNSNTYIREFAQELNIPLPAVTAGAMPLKGW